MMRTRSILIIFLFYSAFAYTQSEEHYYSDSSMKCTYHTTQGRIDGKYISFYANGKKRAEGDFRNNYRYGKWTLWDSIGSVRVKRDYKNPFSFEQLYPENKLNDTQYELKYNKDGYIDYFLLQEKMVVWAKRIWRDLPKDNNPILFKDDTLIKIILKNITSGNITAYSTNDDEFLNPLKPSDIDTSDINIVAYKIKEDCFIDNVRLVAESRIIGICPVTLDTIMHYTKDLFWLYFPEIRKVLATVTIIDKTIPEEVKGLDDLFFYRYFTSSIYKESNVYDRKISDYKFGDDINKEAERIEINLIEMEHDYWLSLSK